MRATATCLEQYLAIARHGNGGVQFMAAAGKRAQLLGGLRAAGGLAEKPRAQRQGLIGADDKSAGMARRHRKRFLARQQRGDIARRRKA